MKIMVEVETTDNQSIRNAIKGLFHLMNPKLAAEAGVPEQQELPLTEGRFNAAGEELATEKQIYVLLLNTGDPQYRTYIENEMTKAEAHALVGEIKARERDHSVPPRKVGRPRKI